MTRDHGQQAALAAYGLTKRASFTRNAFTIPPAMLFGGLGTALGGTAGAISGAYEDEALKGALTGAALGGLGGAVGGYAGGRRLLKPLGERGLEVIDSSRNVDPRLWHHMVQNYIEGNPEAVRAGVVHALLGTGAGAVAGGAAPLVLNGQATTNDNPNT